MKSVSLCNITKSFAGKIVLDNLSLSVDAGIFFALLGPSGCGKTTLLRIIAGLETPDFGRVCLDGEDVTTLPAYKRKINTVFQQQGLFPHLTVYENIAYGLMIKGLPKEEIREKVEKQVRIINLLGLEKKYPATLSGGQQQRVALARSLIMEPAVLLFDEPMSALDVRLKEHLLIECMNLQQTLKTTFIYITHDRKEALTVADKLAIMNFDGKVEQVGSPKKVYQRPTSRFVANFVGDVIIVGGVVESISDSAIVLGTDVGLVTAACTANDSKNITVGLRLFISVRPERIHLAYVRKDGDGYANIISGKIIGVIFSGVFMRYTVQVDKDISFLVFEDDFSFKQNDSVFLHFHSEDVVLLES